MFQKFSITVLALFVSYLSHAGGGGRQLCSASKKHKQLMKTTVGSQLENNYDVKYLFFDIALTNTSTAVSGNVLMRAVTTNTLDTFAFELNSQLTIDSVLVDGIKEPIIISNGSVRKVTLSAIYNSGTSFITQVYYHGQPTSGTGAFFTGGLNYVKLSSGTEMMYSLSDPDFTDDWWPCKQSLTDKIDSVDMWVTVSSNLKAGSNGLLKNITTLPGNKRRFEWKTAYPIDYYLISVAVAEYADYSYYMHFTDGSNDSMLIQNFVYDSAAFMIPARVAALDSTGYIVDHFSKLFGKYPFYKEKYGHCIAEPLGGGMEHQTMTTLAFATTTLIAHELGHQWWGDHVTYSSWRDIWMSEGFATYCEQLFVEKFWGAPVLGYRTDAFNRAMSQPGGSVYVDDTTNVNRIFSSTLTYSKGAAVAHMLRYIAPNDSLYFETLQQYQQQYAMGNAVTFDLQTIAEQVYGRDLDTFFNQWIYGEGYPTYAAKWYQDGTQVYVQINQTTSKPTSVAAFHMPLELKLKSATGDTIIKIYNDKASATYPMPWFNTMTGLEIDPNNHVLNKTGPITKDASVLKIAQNALDNTSIYPNPAKESWHITNVPAGASMKLADIAGRLIWDTTATGAEIIIPSAQLANGTYILSVELNGMSKHHKLMK